VSNDSPGVISSGLPEAVAKLLADAGLGGWYSIRFLRSGGNNRVYRLDVRGKALLLKAYFEHPDDPRDRLGTEFAFSWFAWNHGLHSLPQPLARDPRHHLGLYEFVNGRKLRPDEVSSGAVRQALMFIGELNLHKHLPDAQQLPRASEACFSLAEHLACVESRIQRLSNLDDNSPLVREVLRFVRGDLSTAWNQVALGLHQRSLRCGWSLVEELPVFRRCLSPSDFGFHNALLADDGRLRFLDFEYAGWDDPAKLVCDFFCQPTIPVPLHFYDVVVQQVAAIFNDAALPTRIGLLLPVCQLKWCCILLNDFLPLGRRRRFFAGGKAAQEEQRASQLQKARQVLHNLATPALVRSA